MTDAPLFVDFQAEDAALGAALSNTDAPAVLCGVCAPEDFYQPSRAAVMRVVETCHSAGAPLDETICASMLTNPADGELAHNLPDCCPVAANVRIYAEAVRANAVKRRQLAAMQAYGQALGSDNGSADTAREALRRVLDEETHAMVGAGIARIDWTAFWDHEHNEAEWVYRDVLARGRGHAIYAAHKAGKSLLMLWICGELATGADPVVVSYLDYEMTEADVFDRLEDMGHGPKTDLSRLYYHLLPTLPPLDTSEGAGALTGILDATKAEWPDHHQVVVFDTISRAVAGEENDADTFRDFYNHTGIELKRRGITWARLDHSGKDPARGQRGSSSKADDVDIVWKLTQTDNGVRLQRDFARMGWVLPNVTFSLAEDPLAYTRMAGDWPAGTGEVANILDRLGVPIDISTRQAQAALKAINEGRRRQLVLAAVRWRIEHFVGEL